MYRAEIPDLIPGVALEDKQLRQISQTMTSGYCALCPTLAHAPMGAETFQAQHFHLLPSGCPSQRRRTSLMGNWILGLGVRNGTFQERCTVVSQPSPLHQTAAIINECIKRSTERAEKVDNDLCLPKGKII